MKGWIHGGAWFVQRGQAIEQGPSMKKEVVGDHGGADERQSEGTDLPRGHCEGQGWHPAAEGGQGCDAKDRRHHGNQPEQEPLQACPKRCQQQERCQGRESRSEQGRGRGSQAPRPRAAPVRFPAW